MRAVTFQAPREVRVDERPVPELQAADDAVVAVQASGICGSDLHIYHGRVKMDPGFTIGHEFVGTVLEAGAQVTRVAPGDRVLGCYQSACGTCFFCLRGAYHKCDRMRVFGHGPALGSLQGTQEGRGVDVAVDAVGHPDALDLALRLARKAGTVVAIGVYAEPCQVHMGLVWIKALTLKTGHANVIAHVDRVLGMLATGSLDPTPLVTHHMRLDDAPEAYEIYDRREALKIVLPP